MEKASMKIRCVSLYPSIMNRNGSRGNAFAFGRRCRWRGIQLEVREVEQGDEVDFSRYDIVFLGGGGLLELAAVRDDFLKIKAPSLRDAVSSGLVGLAVGGGYRLAGRSCPDARGHETPGAGILQIWTVPGTRRMIGNVIVEIEIEGRRIEVVGFENHSERTYLVEGADPFGKMIVGFGNNGEDGSEGARSYSFFGTNLDGPLLPSNPEFCDHLIQLAARRRYPGVRLGPLVDDLELAAHADAASRARERRDGKSGCR